MLEGPFNKFPWQVISQIDLKEKKKVNSDISTQTA